MPAASFGDWWRRISGALARARHAHRSRARSRRPLDRVLTGAVCVLAGFMVMVSAWNSQGSDLRPARHTDLVGLIQDQSRRNADLVRRVTGLRAEVDGLSAAEAEPDLTPRLTPEAAAAGLTAVQGPAVTVTLNDAPATVAADGIDPDLLVVHQQDIQAVVNALWSGGAEAMTIQGQRVISTTGVKCVGNTVVLHGIPYAPPYVISAIGDASRLHAALAASEPLLIYQQYVDAYGLGYDEQDVAEASFPAHEGTLDLPNSQSRGSR